MKRNSIYKKALVLAAVLARGNTIIQANDGMLMMGDRQTLAKVAKQFFPDSDYEPD